MVALREGGWTGPLVMIGSENFAPYERPPLSKAVLTEEPSAGPRYILTKERLGDLGITTVFGHSAMSVDRACRTVAISDGSQVSYERLLLATGATPRRLPFAYDSRCKVLTLRTYDDAVSLRRSIRPGARIVVIGGGLIGLEVASSAVWRGASVLVIEAGPRILMRAVPPPMAVMIHASHEKAGVQIETNAVVVGVEGHDGQTWVTLADGRTFSSDVVVVGIGATPNTELAEAAGLNVENGIAVDETLATIDSNIYAAGDCCSFPHSAYNRKLRLEAWRNAQHQGRMAAANMLGSGQVYGDIPWFWSDQYDETLQIAGICPDTLPIERDLGSKGKILYYLDEGGTLAAACGYGTLGAIAKEIRFAEAIIAKGIKPLSSILADPAVNLNHLFATDRRRRTC